LKRAEHAPGAAHEFEPWKGAQMPLFFFTVEQQERAIVERFGKFVRVAGPGLQTKTPFVERVAGRMSLQVEQLNAEIETKTKDNVFVQARRPVSGRIE
jgi:regulator of protease activity HflC (stomatin/prohibitin superfamily)